MIDELKKIVSEMLEVAEADIKPEASFADLGADSLELVELIIIIEEKFRIEIPEKDAEKLLTVQDAIDYLKGKGVQ